MVDLLYIHPNGENPAFSQKFFNKNTNSNAGHFFGFIPMGIIGIINNLIKNNFEVIGINLPLKRKVNPSFDLEKCIKHHKPKIVLIDMHWYVHIKDGLRIANMAKNSGCLVIIGGLSATFFSNILIKNKSIDYIIKGDAEKPLLELSKALIRNKETKNIPNIAYKTFNNKITYICTDIDNYDYVNMDWLEDKDSYIDQFDFWLLVGKGCPYNCENCDGKHENTCLTFGRNKTIWRSSKIITKDLKNITGETIAFSLDLNVMPDNMIKELSKNHFNLNLRNEFLLLANKTKLEKIKNSFNSFDLVFSPTSGSDEERKRLGKHFTNQQFLNNLKEVKKLDLVGGIIIYFTDYMIYPKKEEKLDEKQRNNLIIEIKEIVPEAAIEILPQVIDPGSVKETAKEELYKLYSN